MPTVDEMFPSQWMKASDLQGKEFALTISHIAMEEIGSDHKPVIYFQGAKKGLVLNRTNADAIGQQHGDRAEGWTGKQITIMPAWTQFQGKNVPCIRVKMDMLPGGSMGYVAPPPGTGPAPDGSAGALPGADAPPVASIPADTPDHLEEAGGGILPDDSIPFGPER